jgi:hypothetical protein
VGTSNGEVPEEYGDVIFGVSLAVIQFHYESGLCPNGGCHVVYSAVCAVFPQAEALRHQSLVSWENGWPSYIYLRLPQRKSVNDEGGEYSHFIQHKIELFISILAGEGRSKHPTWPHITSKVVHTDLASKASLLFMKNNLKHCLRGHKACAVATDQARISIMPKRILDIGTMDMGEELTKRLAVRLVEPTNHIASEPYVALSHR